MDCNRQGLTHVHLQMRANALAYNRDSKANGALMRSSPLGIWSVRLNERETVKAALCDAGLTHPNLTCQWANAAYVSALRHLMLFPEDANGAYQAALRALAEDQSASAGDRRDAQRHFACEAAGIALCPVGHVDLCQMVRPRRPRGRRAG